MSPVSEAPTIQRLLPRQTLSPTTSTTTPQTSFIPRPETYRTVNGIPPWAIAVIVIGGLLTLSLCGLLGLRLRTRWRAKRGAMNSITHVFAKGENGDGNGAGGGDPKESTSPDKGSSGVAIGNGSTVVEEGTKTRRRDSLLDQAEVRIRKLIKKTRPATSNSTSRLVHTTTNDDDRPPHTSLSINTGGGASSTTKLRESNAPPPTAFSFEGTTYLDPNSNPLSNNNNDNNTTLFRNFSFKNPFSGGRPQTGSSSVSGPQPHPGTSPPISSPSNHPLSSEGGGGVGGVDYYNSAYYNSLARPSEDDWAWADDSIARTIRGSYDNQDHERDMEDNATTTNHAGTTLYHGYGGGPTSIEGALSDESRSGGGIRTLFGGGIRDSSKGGGRDDNNFDSIPLETRNSPPSGFWNASRNNNNNSRWVTR